MCMTAGDLQQWHSMMRTRYGRFGGKSGDGAKELTERESWIRRAFQFLAKHIKRVPSRQTCAMSIEFRQYTLNVVNRIMCVHKLDALQYVGSVYMTLLSWILRGFLTLFSLFNII